MNEPLVIVTARTPGPTARPRLCPPLSPQQAQAAYAGMVLDALDTAASVPRADVWLAAEDGADPALAALAGDAARVVSTPGERVADRVQDAFTRGFGEGYRRIVLMSADAPDVPAGYLRTVLDRLEDDPALAVVVPSADGSVCVLALAGPRPELLSGVAWGVSTTTEALQAAAQRLRIPLCLLPCWRTVEIHADLADCLARGTARHLASLARHHMLDPEA